MVLILTLICIEIHTLEESSHYDFSQNDHILNFASQSSSTGKLTHSVKNRQSMEQHAPILITTADGHVLSEKPFHGQRMSNVRGRMNFQKSALELNKITKWSLYDRLNKRRLKRIQTLSSLPRSTFTYDYQGTKINSLRKSSDSFNPFRERMLINTRNVAKKSTKRMGINEIIHEHEENVDLNISGSEYSQDHIVTNKLTKKPYVSDFIFISIAKTWDHSQSECTSYNS
jgi:hypothetical protein